MSNAKDAKGCDWKPRDGKTVTFTSFKIKFPKVLESLKKLNVTKSVNSIPNYLLKNCADTIAPSLTKLHKYIVNRAKYPSFWKIGRITPLHKRKEVSKAKNYIPVTVVPNEDMAFENTICEQLYDWLAAFTPDSQFGFLKGCGTQDYGALMALKVMDILERRNEAIIISLDVDGAFDRMWHEGLLHKMEKRGMRGRALKLAKDYLRNRFIQVVVGMIRSALKRIFSGVPQGGKFSQNLWDFDISTLDELDIDGLIAYADDCGLLYEVTTENRDTIIDEINSNLQSLAEWGIQWHATFACDKTEGCLISRKKVPFDVSQLRFQGEKIEFVKEIRMVGFIFDEKMTMGPMVKKSSKKGRAKIAALFRLRPYLDSANLELMYKAFVRSAMEYGNLEYMIAAPSTLQKLDRVQAAAEKLGGFKVESLEARRDASLVGLLFKLLDGKGRGQLNNFKPEVTEMDPKKICRNTLTGLQIVDKTNSKSLMSYERSIVGRAPAVWKIYHKMCSDLERKTIGNP